VEVRALTGQALLGSRREPRRSVLSMEFVGNARFIYNVNCSTFLGATRSKYSVLLGRSSIPAGRLRSIGFRSRGTDPPNSVTAFLVLTFCVFRWSSSTLGPLR